MYSLVHIVHLSVEGYTVLRWIIDWLKTSERDRCLYSESNYAPNPGRIKSVSKSRILPKELVFQKNVVFFPRTETAQRMNAMENASKNAGEPLWQNWFGQPVNHIALVAYILEFLKEIHPGYTLTYWIHFFWLIMVVAKVKFLLEVSGVFHTRPRPRWVDLMLWIA